MKKPRKSKGAIIPAPLPIVRSTHALKSTPKTGGLVPPKETRWKKGCASPNPQGRGLYAAFSQAAKALLAEVDPAVKVTGAERLLQMAYRRALQGSYRHLALLLGYAEGKPRQAVEICGLTPVPLTDDAIDQRLAELLADKKEAVQ